MGLKLKKIFCMLIITKRIFFNAISLLIAQFTKFIYIHIFGMCLVNILHL